MKIIDLSFNPLGTYGKLEEPKKPKKKKRTKQKSIPENSAESFSEMFKLNKTLIHWDFSNWRFSKEEWILMMEGLNQNHTILGLHMIGNEMNTDSLGYLKDGKGDPAASHILSNVSKSQNNKENTQSKYGFNVASNWWIWEKWTYLKLKIDLSKLIPDLETDIAPKDKVYIHYSFDNYEPDILTFDNKSGSYYSERMVRMHFHNLPIDAS